MRRQSLVETWPVPPQPDMRIRDLLRLDRLRSPEVFNEASRHLELKLRKPRLGFVEERRVELRVAIENWFVVKRVAVVAHRAHQL